jgi:hypothetical protein
LHSSNRHKSALLAKVELPFRIIKQLWYHARVRYGDLAKNTIRPLPRATSIKLAAPCSPTLKMHQTSVTLRSIHSTTRLLAPPFVSSKNIPMLYSPK